jgi:hypothetical protein
VALVKERHDWERLDAQRLNRMCSLLDWQSIRRAAWSPTAQSAATRAAILDQLTRALAAPALPAPETVWPPRQRPR